MSGARVIAAIAGGLAAAAFAWTLGAGRAYGWPWSTDMAKQPTVKPQAAPRPSPAGSVPVQGKEPALDRIEAGKKLSNPVAATPASLANGKRLFQTYCTPCHGPAAKGDGEVAKKFIPPPDLTLEAFRRRPDGFIYETIKSGGPIMPSQGEALLPRERWEIVIYLRSLQGQ
jgi:mono/diheme cytochrome c family protein